MRAGKAEEAVARLRTLPRCLECSLMSMVAGEPPTPVSISKLARHAAGSPLAVLHLAVADAGAALAALGVGSFPALIDVQLHLQGDGGAVGVWPDGLSLERLGLTGREPAQASAMEALVRAVGDAAALVHSLRLLRVATAAFVPVEAALGLRHLTALRRVEVVVPATAAAGAANRAARQAYARHLTAGLRADATVAVHT
eukprot:TRINITY_DN16226_c0_g1_i1.p1 TRINITY_DN16226_c0_g1~~TRINITY_DN16226_c0_g1_i1.p1  ORF type:complete len:199 (-),score=53.07 TRINITY_DN16226_c0_g1_i1:236-832(-)